MAEGWTIGTLVAPTPLAGANGLRFGPCGALYVAQANGGQISRIDLATGAAAPVALDGGELIGPDDLAFDSLDNMFVTEVMGGRVSVRRANGRTEVITDDAPCANGITVHHDRLIVSEFRPGGRIIELACGGGPPRTIADGLMMPNALQVGPDGMLYYPLVPLGEIWRVGLDGSASERVFAGLAFPTAVKFDTSGQLWVTEAASGVVSSIDPATGRQMTVHHLEPGLDNLTFAPDGRLIVSYFTDGLVAEVTRDGAIIPITERGLLGPFGMTADASGALLVADGASLARIDRQGRLSRFSLMLEANSPGYARAISAQEDESLLVTNTGGQVMLIEAGGGARPLADGFDQLMGVTGNGAGGAIVCEAGAGRILAIDASGAVAELASALDRPAGVLRRGDGSVIFSESGAGRVRMISGRDTSTLLDGLVEPHGVAEAAAGLFVIDYGTGNLHLVPRDKSEPRVIAAGLPAGSRGGRRWRSLPGVGEMLPGPILPFSDLAAFSDGRIAIGLDATGAIGLISQSA